MVCGKFRGKMGVGGGNAGSGSSPEAKSVE